MSDPTVDSTHAQKLSEFTDLLNLHGADSAEVQMYIVTCEDPALVELCRTVIRVQRYLRENLNQAMGIPPDPWERTQEVKFDDLNLFGKKHPPKHPEGGVYALTYVPLGRHSPVGAFSLVDRRTCGNDAEAREWARTRLRDHGDYGNLRAKGILSRLSDGRMFLCIQVPRGKKLSGLWEWFIMEEGSTPPVLHRCFYPESAPKPFLLAIP